jgi:hypothetical protein
MLMRDAKWMFLSAVGFVTITASLLSLAVPITVLGAGPNFGVFTWNKTRLVMIDGYAHVKPDLGGKTKVIAVTLVSMKLDRTAIDRALDRNSAINEQARAAKGTVIEFIFGTDGTFKRMNAQIRAAGNVQALSTGGLSFKANLKTNTPERVAGRIQSDGTETFSSDTFAFDFTFDIPVTAEPALGNPLPAGGGDAGKAYVALIAALQKGDVDTIARFWPKEKAAQMLAARKEPDFKKGLEMVKAFSPKTVTVTGGTIRGDIVDLDVVGKDADGNVMDGKVRMVKDGTSWRLEAENLTTHMK